MFSIAQKYMQTESLGMPLRRRCEPTPQQLRLSSPWSSPVSLYSFSSCHSSSPPQLYSEYEHFYFVISLQGLFPFLIPASTHLHASSTQYRSQSRSSRSHRSLSAPLINQLLMSRSLAPRYVFAIVLPPFLINSFDLCFSLLFALPWTVEVNGNIIGRGRAVAVHDLVLRLLFALHIFGVSWSERLQDIGNRVRSRPFQGRYA